MFPFSSIVPDKCSVAPSVVRIATKGWRNQHDNASVTGTDLIMGGIELGCVCHNRCKIMYVAYVWQRECIMQQSRQASEQVSK